MGGWKACDAGSDVPRSVFPENRPTSGGSGTEGSGPNTASELEKTSFEGTIGHIEFYGKNDEFTHGLKAGPGYVTGLVFQWQNGKQVTVWPDKIAEGRLEFPKFVKLSQ